MTLRKDNKKLKPWNLLKSEDSGTKEPSHKRVSSSEGVVVVVVATSGVGRVGSRTDQCDGTGNVLYK